jgi:hypothetical protein
MADANTRLERLHRRNAVRGNTEPIICRQQVSAEEEDLESSYLPSGRTEPLLSFTATATSCARSGSQLAPAQALAMAQELLHYQPTADGCEGWHARIAELVAIANKDPACGRARSDGGAPCHMRRRWEGHSGQEGGFPHRIFTARGAQLPNRPTRSGRRTRLSRAPPRKS